MTLPDISQQLESNSPEQEALLCEYLSNAILRDAPDQNTLRRMVEMAADHAELIRLGHIAAIQDDTIRGAMFMSLLGEIMCRCFIQEALRYNRRIKR